MPQNRAFLAQTVLGIEVKKYKFCGTLFLSKKEAILYNFLDRATVRKYFDEHISGVKNHRLLIWSLISFEQFLQNFYSSET